MTRFLSNDSLWSELTEQVKKAKKVKAAVAYLGSGGADLLPLKKGDILVVNLGLQTVKQGATSPKEIQRLVKRGVVVFTRSTLHAKFFICGRTLLVGSANISNNSQQVLDEAASLTTDSAAVRRANDFFDKLCTEPVRPEYLKRCLKEYKPPVFVPVGDASKSTRQKRVIEAKLWFIGGLSQGCLPAAETETANGVQKAAGKRLQKSQGTFVDFIHYPSKPSYLKHIRPGDWIVTCIADSEGYRYVYAPQQVIDLESYPRGQGKRRYLLLSEAPEGSEGFSLSEFRRRVRAVAPRLDAEHPRTTAIENVSSADSILSLWTPGGRVSTQSKGRS